MRAYTDTHADTGSGLFDRTIGFRALAVVLALLAWPLFPMAGTAQATPTWCAEDEVTVIVEGVGEGCSPAGLNGAETLEAAGFTLEYVQTQPGFICRINGQPTDDPCIRTPPASAYWAYYHADLGGTWEYSQLGAQSYYPKAGTVEAWAYGDGARPGPVPDRPEPDEPEDDFTYTPDPEEPDRGDGNNPGGTGGSPGDPSAGDDQDEQSADTPRDERPAQPDEAAPPEEHRSGSPLPTRPRPEPSKPNSSARSTAPSTTSSDRQRQLDLEPRAEDEGNDVNGDRQLASEQDRGAAVEDTGPGLWPLVGILAVAVAIGAGAWWYSRRREQMDP